MNRKNNLRGLAAACVFAAGLTASGGRAAAQPVYISFVWHMHQPYYWPGEDIVATAQAGRYSFDVVTVHTDRTGPYTTWPRDAATDTAPTGTAEPAAR